jgi:hypothetical protein
MADAEHMADTQDATEAENIEDVMQECLANIGAFSFAANTQEGTPLTEYQRKLMADLDEVSERARELHATRTSLSSDVQRLNKEIETVEAGIRANKQSRDAACTEFELAKQRMGSEFRRKLANFENGHYKLEVLQAIKREHTEFMHDEAYRLESWYPNSNELGKTITANCNLVRETDSLRIDLEMSVVEAQMLEKAVRKMEHLSERVSVSREDYREKSRKLYASDNDSESDADGEDCGMPDTNDEKAALGARHADDDDSQTLENISDTIKQRREEVGELKTECSSLHALILEKRHTLHLRRKEMCQTEFDENDRQKMRLELERMRLQWKMKTCKFKISQNEYEADMRVYFKLDQAEIWGAYDHLLSIAVSKSSTKEKSSQSLTTAMAKMHAQLQNELMRTCVLLETQRGRVARLRESLQKLNRQWC